MPNDKNGNLIPNPERSPKELSDNGKKGGKKSGEARRQKKERREIFRDVLEGRYTDKKSGESVTGEELLIRGIAVNLSDPKSKNWLGTAKMVVEAMGYNQSPELRDKLTAEINRIKAETELTKAKVEELKRYDDQTSDLPDDPLTASLREEAERMNDVE